MGVLFLLHRDKKQCFSFEKMLEMSLELHHARTKEDIICESHNNGSNSQLDIVQLISQYSLVHFQLDFTVRSSKA